ncbi:MAG: hypothetical protein GC131_00740 [Alphaproteobacteria bacterium]|nr:hypothetical protein [Alphaproteobacteria bacterium]
MSEYLQDRGVSLFDPSYALVAQPVDPAIVASRAAKAATGKEILATSRMQALMAIVDRIAASANITTEYIAFAEGMTVQIQNDKPAVRLVAQLADGSPFITTRVSLHGAPEEIRTAVTKATQQIATTRSRMVAEAAEWKSRPVVPSGDGFRRSGPGG